MVDYSKMGTKKQFAVTFTTIVTAKDAKSAKEQVKATANSAGLTYNHGSARHYKIKKGTLKIFAKLLKD
jgi:protein tyrosine phosphatase (PTP) superfamily phosphohydrolase (DUF442 family)